MVEAARREGIEVTIDQYPYTASSTSISTLLPDDVLADGQDSIRARLQRPGIRKQVTDHILARLKKRKLKHLSYAVIAYFSPDTTYNGILSVGQYLIRNQRTDRRTAGGIGVLINRYFNSFFTGGFDHGYGDFTTTPVLLAT